MFAVVLASRRNPVFGTKARRELANELERVRKELAKERRRVERLRERQRDPKLVTEAFHLLYYRLGVQGKTWRDTRWLGVPAQKLPLDLWIYQEIVFETRPTLVIETGTADGGSALYLASLFDILGEGRVVTVDISPVGYSGEPRPEHPRVRYVLGSSTDEAVLEEVRGEAAGERVLVILDSDHSEAHVSEELRAYSPLADDYLIVEDSNVNGHPVLPDHGPGPMEAVQEFLKGNEEFVVDDTREKFYLTFNPKGYLRRAP